jgi:putative tricarboxylic transport membrane protein
VIHKSNTHLRTLLTLVLASFVSIILIPSSGHAAPEIDSIHFLIPGGAGGGWDGTARGTGEALTKVFPQSFRDLTPVAGTIADYGAFVVRADSPIKSWKDVVAGFKENPRKMKFAGGSSKGSLDHLVPAAAIKAEGLDPKALRYIPYDAGGKAMAGLLSGEAQLLSTGLGEALEMSKAGQVRILAITAPERLKDAPDVPTLVEMGNPTVFANWRGFFGAPGLSKAEAKAYADVLGKMYQTPEWETVRARNGWVNVYKPGDEFYSFLEEQEKQVGDLMRELGFL